jgi:hypothetical protein
VLKYLAFKIAAAVTERKKEKIKTLNSDFILNDSDVVLISEDEWGTVQSIDTVL